MHDKIVIFNADDFGLSRRVNAAVVKAHREGVLRSASLMVAEPFAEEAVALARGCPDLEIGLHVVLCQGRPVLSPEEIPAIARRDGRFHDEPTLTGMRLFFRPGARDQIAREVRAQCERFQALVGRRPSHVNGHLNIHVHPAVLPAVIAEARARGVPGVRLPREPAASVLAVDPRGALGARWNGFIFDRLTARAEPRLRAAGLRFPARCHGVLRPFEMGEALVGALVERLPPGLSEVYAHPGHPFFGAAGGSDEAPCDLETLALTSGALRARLVSAGVRLGGYETER